MNSYDLIQAQEEIARLSADLQAARARLDEVLRLGKAMRDEQRASESDAGYMRTRIACEAAFDAELARGNTAALSPGDNAAGS